MNNVFVAAALITCSLRAHAEGAVTGLVGSAATGAIISGPVGAAVGGVAGAITLAAIELPPREMVTYVQQQPSHS